MNIFVLDFQPKLAAKYHCNKHVVKMISESVMMLSVAHGLQKGYANHPCTVWAKSSSDNYQWLSELTQELCKEYTRRYGRTHKSEELFHERNLHLIPSSVPNGFMTDFPQAMPDQYRNHEAVTAYREYYLGEKLRFAKYHSIDDIPPFIVKHCEQNSIDPTQFIRTVRIPKSRKMKLSTIQPKHSKEYHDSL